MSDFITKLKSMVTLDMIIIALLALAGILAISIVMRYLRIKKVRRELEELEIKYNELKGYPLSFKLNKAIALSKVNKTILEQVGTYQQQYDQVQDKLKEFSVLLAEIDDFAYSKKIKKASAKIEEVNAVIADTSNAVYEISALLDDVLEQESTQRANINTLKNGFREDKRKLNENRSSYRQSIEYLDDFVSQIENMFSIFEEWMFASEFNKASDKQQEIKESLADLEFYLESLPSLYEKATIALPGKIDELKMLTSSCVQKGVYLEHLEIEKNIELLHDLLSDSLMKMSKCNLERVPDALQECESRLRDLKADVEQEDNSYEVVTTKANALFLRIKDLNNKVQGIREVYERVNERFGFEKLGSTLVIIDDELDRLNEMRFKLESVISNNSVPFSTLMISYNEVLECTDKIELMTKELKVKLDNATSDEERAKKQLIKLQLIVNEMRIKIAKHRLPSMDSKYEEDIRNANVYIVDIKEILDEVPLNVERLNAKLKEAIDYIYTLYNSVNNLVGMAVMVENAIVFGNKYRSEYVEIDSELTRAELCFTNGQYTKALKIAISAIERLHPGTYENLLKEGEQAHA